ncbi:MAG: glycoside hydrolase family 26 protein [Bacteroidales bacterium]|nr:glycoside hydrolase family 26 protein [Bacteroidales bacterium]
MKHLKYIMPLLALGFALGSCNDDDDTYGVQGEGTPAQLTSQSIAEGAVVPAETTELTLTYDVPVAVNQLVTPTINGTAVDSWGYVTDEDGNTDRKTLKATFSLRVGQSYTINVPERCVTAIGSRAFCQELNINFSTASPTFDKSKVATALTNSNATAEAKSVYTKLLNLYGEKQLSGAMGEVAWATGYCDLINSTYGKYPAIVGFDFIHLPYSPANWIDYGDITPVQKIYNAGSIPAITWHWLVPTSQPGEFTVWEGEQVMPADWSGFVMMTDDAAMTVWKQVSIGTVITVAMKDCAAGAQGSFKNGSTWSGFAPAWEYFDISGDSFSMTVTSDNVDDIRANGVIVSGHDYTATSVTVTIPGGNDLSYDTTAFHAANVPVAGTYENTVAEADVAKVAGYLKLLQDAGIPVLWRPFHEAAGDYTWGAWFWWGYDGVEATKALWTWLYDKLTNEYGLNNLIWVWTMQTTNAGSIADASQLQAAYPGDQYVDIVGADLYESALSNQSDRFLLINQAISGSKIIALSECGNLLDPDAAYENSALWSFFMGWYELDNGTPTIGASGWNTTGEWGTVLNNPLVLSQGEF